MTDTGRRRGGALIGAHFLMAVVLVLTMLAGTGPLRAEDPAPDLGRWVMRCDATLCKASLPSSSGREALLVARWVGNDGYSIGFATPFSVADRDRPVDVTSDTGRVVGAEPTRDYAPLERSEAFWFVDARPATALFQALTRARTLRISYLDILGAPHDADFTLDAPARLLDAMDKRLPPAPKRQGLAPPKSVAPPPALTRADLIARMGLPERLLMRHRAASDCEDPGSPLLKAIAPVIGPLSKTAFLYAIPCSSSAGNVAFKLWVLETGEIGGITPLFFSAYDPTFGWRGSDLLYNVTYDPAASRLTSQFKGRSEGGCGNRGVWHWKDFAFAMDEFRVSADCGSPRAATEFPSVYPTR